MKTTKFNEQDFTDEVVDYQDGDDDQGDIHDAALYDGDGC